MGKLWGDFPTAFDLPCSCSCVVAIVVLMLLSSLLGITPNIRHSKWTAKKRNYKLTIDGYSGTSYDSFGSANASFFSTFDRDNDGISPKNCAARFGGGFWYAEHCGFVFVTSSKNPKWYGLTVQFNRRFEYSELSFVRMTLKRT